MGAPRQEAPEEQHSKLISGLNTQEHTCVPTHMWTNRNTHIAQSSKFRELEKLASERCLPALLRTSMKRQTDWKEGVNWTIFIFFHKLLSFSAGSKIFMQQFFFLKLVGVFLFTFQSRVRGKRRQRRSFYNRVRWNAFCHLLPWPEWPFTHLPAIRFWPHFSGQLAFNGKCLWDRYTIYCTHCSRASVSRKITEQKTA